MKTLYYKFLYLLFINPYYTLVTSILFTLILRVMVSPDIVYAGYETCAGESPFHIDKEGNIVERNPVRPFERTEKEKIIISKEECDKMIEQAEKMIDDKLMAEDKMIEDAKPRSGNVRYPAFVEKMASLLLSEPITSTPEPDAFNHKDDSHSYTDTYSSDTSSERETSSSDSEYEDIAHHSDYAKILLQMSALINNSKSKIDLIEKSLDYISHIIPRSHMARDPSEIKDSTSFINAYLNNFTKTVIHSTDPVEIITTNVFITAVSTYNVAQLLHYLDNPEMLEEIYLDGLMQAFGSNPYVLDQFLNVLDNQDK